MPKLTITGKELGCSELPSIVETHEKGILMLELVVMSIIAWVM